MLTLQPVAMAKPKKKEPTTAFGKALRAAGYDTPADFARATSLPESTVRSHENGTRPLTMNYAKVYAKHLPKVNWVTLVTENIDTPGLPQSNIAPLAFDDKFLSPRELPRDVPVLGTASCGEDGLFEFYDANAIDFVPRTPRIAGRRDVYAVYAVGESMSPWRKPLEPIYIDPKRRPQIGDHVLIQMKQRHDGEPPRAYVKKLVKIDGKRLTVEQYKPPKTFHFKIAEVDMDKLHRVIETSELLG